MNELRHAPLNDYPFHAEHDVIAQSHLRRVISQGQPKVAPCRGPMWGGRFILAARRLTSRHKSFQQILHAGAEAAANDGLHWALRACLRPLTCGMRHAFPSKRAVPAPQATPMYSYSRFLPWIG